MEVLWHSHQNLKKSDDVIIFYLKLISINPGIVLKCIDNIFMSKCLTLILNAKNVKCQTYLNK